MGTANPSVIKTLNRWMFTWGYIELCVVTLLNKPNPYSSNQAAMFFRSTWCYWDKNMIYWIVSTVRNVSCQGYSVELTPHWGRADIRFVNFYELKVLKQG